MISRFNVSATASHYPQMCCGQSLISPFTGWKKQVWESNCSVDFSHSDAVWFWIFNMTLRVNIFFWSTGIVGVLIVFWWRKVKMLLMERNRFEIHSIFSTSWLGIKQKFSCVIGTMNWGVLIIYFKFTRSKERLNLVKQKIVTSQNNVKVLTVQVVICASTAVKALVALWWQLPREPRCAFQCRACWCCAFCSKVHLVQIVK